MESSLFLTNQQSFALYRLPNALTHFLVKQKDDNHTRFDHRTFDKQGFVFYPFSKSARHPAVFIKNEVVLPNAVVHFYSEHQKELKVISKTAYLEKVRQFINATESQFKKLIFSRIKLINMPMGDLFELFKALKAAYPKAFVYLVNIAGIGCWVGASPETLFTQNGLAHTMALAGTQPNLGIPLEKVQWGEKEIEEQTIVENYFQKILKNKNIPFEQSDTQTVSAGNILHLCAHFTFNPQGQVYELMSDLHPSPAVCGMPKAEAKQFILDQEPHDRAYYCGFLGPVNLHQSTDLFVNLRCMQVLKSKFALYVGGGILPNSDPEKEWEETEMKAKTLGDVIEKVYSRAMVL